MWMGLVIVRGASGGELKLWGWTFVGRSEREAAEARGEVVGARRRRNRLVLFRGKTRLDHRLQAVDEQLRWFDHHVVLNVLKGENKILKIFFEITKLRRRLWKFPADVNERHLTELLSISVLNLKNRLIFINAPTEVFKTKHFKNLTVFKK